MATTQFALVTDWHLAAPLEAVWRLLEATGDWPEWWPAVARVERLREGDANGVGAVHRLTWKTALPYTLAFDVETVRVEPMSEIEGHASGELDGTGIWTLHPEPGGTHVRYLWRVEVTRRWMRLLAPLLRPVFAWNHDKVMAWGLAGARARLGIG